MLGRGGKQRQHRLGRARYVDNGARFLRDNDSTMRLGRATVRARVAREAAGLGLDFEGARPSLLAGSRPGRHRLLARAAACASMLGRTAVRAGPSEARVPTPTRASGGRVGRGSRLRRRRVKAKARAGRRRLQGHRRRRVQWQ